jgi:uncharacterized protein
VTFAQAATVFLDPLSLRMPDTEHSQVEERWFTLRMSSGGKFLAVSHTHTITDPDVTTMRIISARETRRRERRQHENEL